METNTDAPCDGCTYAARRAAETRSTLICVCERQYPPPHHVVPVLTPLLAVRRPLDERMRARPRPPLLWGFARPCPPVRVAPSRTPACAFSWRPLPRWRRSTPSQACARAMATHGRNPARGASNAMPPQPSTPGLRPWPDHGRASCPFARYLHLSTDARMTAWWLAQRGGAVRSGASVGLAAWADVYGFLDGPRILAECAERATVLASAAEAKLRGLKHRAATGRFSETLAREIDDACSAESQARSMRDASRKELRVGARALRSAVGRMEGRVTISNASTLTAHHVVTQGTKRVAELRAESDATIPDGYEPLGARGARLRLMVSPRTARRHMERIAAQQRHPRMRVVRLPVPVGKGAKRLALHVLWPKPRRIGASAQ